MLVWTMIEIRIHERWIQFQLYQTLDHRHWISKASATSNTPLEIVQRKFWFKLGLNLYSNKYLGTLIRSAKIVVVVKESPTSRVKASTVVARVWDEITKWTQTEPTNVKCSNKSNSSWLGEDVLSAVGWVSQPIHGGENEKNECQNFGPSGQCNHWITKALFRNPERWVQYFGFKCHLIIWINKILPKCKM